MLEFWKNEWKLFLEDIDSLKNVFARIFGRKEDYLMLKSGMQDQNAYDQQLGYGQQNDQGSVQQQVGQVEQQAVDNSQGIGQVGGVAEISQNSIGDVALGGAVSAANLDTVFGQDEGVVNELSQNIDFSNAQASYQLDSIDHKVTSYFGESIDELRVNMSGERTQHEVLRDYAQYFKPYTEAQDMCNSAFRKYYDRHALKIATEELPIQQTRIIQNNVDLFIKGQEVFGENGQFIDSRVDTLFDKIGIEQVNKVVGILHDNTDEDVNLQGERLFAEVITYMVDNGIKIEKGTNILDPIKSVLEEKLDDVHSSLKNHEDWNEEYQALLSQERKYLYALNRIEQYETEQRISEFEERLNEIDAL